MMTVTVTKAGLVLCAALGINDCEFNDRTVDNLFGEWMYTRGPEFIFYCNPRGCHGISPPEDRGLPSDEFCYVPLDYFNSDVTDYEDRGNYVFCDPNPPQS